jgi:hypothetical protein
MVSIKDCYKPRDGVLETMFSVRYKLKFELQVKVKITL